MSRQRRDSKPAGPGRGARRVRRNDPCPCGSGRRFADCCRVASAGTKTTASLVDASWSWSADVDRIVAKAAAGVSHVIRIGPLVMFSTHTGDAWLLDAEDGAALPLARGGDRLPARISEADATFLVEWTHDYEIGADSFVVIERTSGQLRRIRGYHPDLLANLALG